MNFTKISNAVTSKLGRQGLKLQKQSPTIMFGAGVVGVIGTVVLASRATLQLEGILDDHDNYMARAAKAKAHADAGETKLTYTEADLNRDKCLIYGKTAGSLIKAYGPAFLLGAVSIGLLTGSHVAMHKRNASLIAAYTAVDTAFKEYRTRVRAELGEEKDLHFRYGTQDKEIYSETKKGEPIVETKKVVSEGAGYSMYAKFFEPGNPNFQPNAEVNLSFLKMHERYLNQRLQAVGHVFLNEVYDSLGMPRTPEGQAVGWLKENHLDEAHPIDFGLWDDDRSDKLLDFLSGREDHILVDFNVDGPIYRFI